MKLTIIRALMAFLAILWTISAIAVTRDVGDGMNINVTPSCIVVGAPLDFVIVNTNLPFDQAEGKTIALLVENDETKIVYSTFTEADGRGELVAKFPFSEVSGYVSGSEEAWMWLYVYDDDECNSASDYVKVHDYQSAD